MYRLSYFYSRRTKTLQILTIVQLIDSHLFEEDLHCLELKGGVGKFEKPARDTLFVIFHGMLLTSR